MTQKLAPGGTTQTTFKSTIGRCTGALGVLLAAFALIFTALASPAHAAVDTFSQCDTAGNVAVGTGGGLGATCSVTVTNNLDLSTGVTSSTVVEVYCLGPANTLVECTTVTLPSQNLTTTVDQCNGVEADGSSLECHVIVVNNITGDSTESPATVDQCVGSADGSGVLDCTPVQSTTNADVTQCNGSGNGGGSSVTCTVTPSSKIPSAIPIIINQCNGSANGGGSTVLCDASITNNILPAVPPSTTTTTAGGGTTTTTAGGGTTTTTAGGGATTAPGDTSPATTQPGSGGSDTTTETGGAGGVIGGGGGVIGALPATGTDSGWLAMVGGALVAMGGIALISRRRTAA